MFSSYKCAAACLRHGALCALASVSLLSARHASANTPAPPTLSGAPPTAVLAFHTYSFTPVAKGPSGYTLKFSISGKPTWASFNATTGTLSGVPQTANLGTYSNVVISVSDGVASASLAPFTIHVNHNVTPTISGVPPTTATVGIAYSFTPKGAQTDGDPLSYTVLNKPSWASFSIATGTLSGSPSAANVGTYSNVKIRVSTGYASATIGPFSITVASSAPSAPPASSGTVTINWTPPTQNTDGSTLTNLAGYHIYYGTSQSALTKVVNITNPGLASYVISNLSAATWYFSVTSLNSKGVESPRSASVSHVVQ